jgi:hypothetical protein
MIISMLKSENIRLEKLKKHVKNKKNYFFKKIIK